MTPARGLLLARAVESEETFAGGRVLLLPSTRERLTAQQHEVLAVGEWETCEDDECEREHWTNGTGQRKLHPCELEAGDWIIVEPRVAVELEDGTRLVRQAHVLARITP